MRISSFTLLIGMITISLLTQCSPGDNKSRTDRTVTYSKSEKNVLEENGRSSSSGTKSSRSESMGEAAGAGDSKDNINHPPEIKKARIVFDNSTEQPALRTDVTFADSDGDDVSLEYNWYINDKFVSSENRLYEFKRDDRVMLRVRPFDGKDYGSSRTVIFNVGNSPPEVLNNNAFSFVNNTYRYKVKAHDRDGDHISFHLVKAPEGMEIDSETGVILWKVTSETKGKFPVQVKVTDGHGGEALYDFEVTIGTEGGESPHILPKS